MRFIDTSNFLPGEAWHKKATRQIQKLIDAAVNKPAEFEKEKKKVFESGLWSDLNKALTKLSDHKCWYCESTVDREYGAVDHFRPKGQIFDEADHPGYWWLALEPSNYRLSCTRCNSPSKDDQDIRGKWNWFPLLPGSTRALKPGDDIRLERPVLLDPTNKDDVELLIYELDGKPYPAYTPETDPIKHYRALKSIELYYLDKEKTCERRRDVFLVPLNNAVKRISELEAILDQLPQPRRARIEQIIGDTKIEIESRILPQAEYLMASVNLLLNHRGELPWLDSLLINHGYLN